MKRIRGLFMAALLVSTGCAWTMSGKRPAPAPSPSASASPLPSPTPSPKPSATPSPRPSILPIDLETEFAGPAPVKGWVPQYETFIRGHLTQAVLDYPSQSYCPRWAKLSTAERREMWVAVLRATALLESGYDRLQMFREPGQHSDTTGMQNVSEGLLQLSYGDARCGDLFLWSKDRAGFLDDFPRMTKKGRYWTGDSRHPERTTLNPYRNLLCGIRTFDRLASRDGARARPFRSVFGAYWSTIRDSKTDASFRKFFPPCFAAP